MVIKKGNGFDYALGLAMLGEHIEDETYRVYVEKFCSKRGINEEELIGMMKEFGKGKVLSISEVNNIKQWVKKSRFRNTMVLQGMAKQYVEELYKLLLDKRIIN